MHVFDGGMGDEPDLFLHVRDALDAGHPSVFLEMASALIQSLRPRERSPWEPEDGLDTAADPHGWQLADLIDSFIHTPVAETTALLAAFEQLGDVDEVTARRVRQTLRRRPHRLPAWLAGLGGAAVERVVEMGDDLGDDENLMLGLVVPDGDPTTLVALIDHTMGSALKDAFCVPLALDDAVAAFRDIAAGEATRDVPPRFTDIDPAVGRARLEEGLRIADMTLGMPHTETWPMVRPLLEWAISLLPAGGEVPEPREWSQAEVAAVVDGVLASSHVDALRDDPDTEALVELLVEYAAHYAGDPLRWTPVTVEILLLDWVPRKVMADRAYLEKVPAVAEAVVRFAHSERGLPAAVTSRTVTSIGTCTAEFLQAISGPRRMGPMALLEQMGALDPDEGWTDPDEGWDDWSPEQYRRERLEAQVGGAAALAALTDEPLPDEPLDVSGLAPEDADRARAVAGLTDGWCDTAWDVELRTACRRLITETQRSNPATLRRGQVQTAAAAICWLIGNANEAFARHDVRIMDLQAHLGVKASPRERALTILDTLDIPIDYTGYHLDSPAFLTSAQRRWIIRQRDELA